MNNKRNKRGPVRTQRNRSVTADGVYSNPHFMCTATAQVGTIVRVKTRGEDVWEGIFKTFSSSFDVVLEVATLIGKNDNPNATAQIGTLVEKLIFPVNDIVSLSAKDVDLGYATRDTFQTDSAISARLNGASREERELEPWEGELNGTDTPLELDSSANGWDANDMFKKNELEYGVTSTFDQSLRGYTVQLQHSDSPDYKEAEAKAAQIANEIESQPSRKARLELENGDEESVYAAVVRPTEPTNGKYIPPAKRKNQNNGKMARTSPPPQPPATNNSPQTANSCATAAAPNSGNAPAQTTASKGAQTVTVTSYSQTSPVPNVPPQQQQQPPQSVPPPQAQLPQPQNHLAVPHIQQQVPAQAQVPVQNQGHQPRQGHGYRQGGQKGQHMNGDSNKVLRGPRNVYQSGPPPNLPPQMQQPPPPLHAVPGYQGGDMQQKMVEMNHNGHNNRHHREEVKELQQFSQDFQLGPKEVPPQGPPPPQPVPEPQVMPPCAQQQQQPPNLKPQQEVPSPQPSTSPQADGAVDKVTTALKKSTLNPNAKEFVLNPAAKPFMPRSVDSYNNFNSRSPSTPSLSRPHTPQTPSHPQFISTTMNGPMGQPPTSMIVPMGYMMPSQAQYPVQQPQGNRMRKLPAGQIRGGECLSQMSQMQVAAATGQPLLAPAPLGQFVYQSAGINPATYHQMHGVRMYDAPPQLQYLPPQQSQGGGQPQYAQGQPPQAPPQQYQAAPPPQGGVQTHQYLPMCNIIPQPHMLQGMQYLPQVPPPQHPIPLILHNQQHQVHQGPA
ncbi:ataxin-2 homolog isoform X2 [Coccinella septempunctata]|uniref:ataxin-2 homolog isoform X2 n=1 Tax=Coccinella septempunctata TaxID=41139 RepID=UPI001D086239|nr:ataxin-2 homolog isoform X2 [Coccinella septempunctata]